MDCQCYRTLDSESDGTLRKYEVILGLICIAWMMCARRPRTRLGQGIGAAKRECCHYLNPATEGKEQISSSFKKYVPQSLLSIQYFPRKAPTVPVDVDM